jgi:hypothetical protein
MSIVVVGAAQVYRLEVTMIDQAAKGVNVFSTQEPPTEAPSALNDRHRQAVAAVAAGYFALGPRFSPRPLSYGEAGQLAGLPGTTIKKRFEELRREMELSGVPGMDSPDSRAAVVEWCLAHGLVSASDLPSEQQRG